MKRDCKCNRPERLVPYDEFREWAITEGAEFPTTMESLKAWIRHFGWTRGCSVEHLLHLINEDDQTE